MARPPQDRARRGRATGPERTGGATWRRTGDPEPPAGQDPDASAQPRADGFGPYDGELRVEDPLDRPTTSYRVLARFVLRWLVITLVASGVVMVIVGLLHGDLW